MKTTTVYLVHFERAYKHARHYIGSTKFEVAKRMALHQSKKGAVLLRVLVENDIAFEVVRTWEGDRQLERKLKSRKNSKKLCPLCSNRGTHAKL